MFFRNLNLGRPNCPDRVQFETAFLDAGAVRAASFLVNGTLAFSVAPGMTAEAVLSRACGLLRERCGLKEPAFLRRMDALAALVAQDPFAGIDHAAVYGCYATFLHHDAAVADVTALRSAKGDVDVLRLSRTEALSVAYRFGASPGSPNALLESRLGLPATTRVWNTVVRLVARHG
ncbi:DUF1697 domain-containing protein [Jeongeupia chitinilytica]|uniref:DUF1697 domain-containing protein n=1 Tax=Jeongeupia chitinilytica TaxID=1041641 RepID=UPI001E58758C|nr:DUF1697 domain-containing protein [Jeongeupia chitinilytica]